MLKVSMTSFWVLMFSFQKPRSPDLILISKSQVGSLINWESNEIKSST